MKSDSKSINEKIVKIINIMIIVTILLTVPNFVCATQQTGDETKASTGDLSTNKQVENTPKQETVNNTVNTQQDTPENTTRDSKNKNTATNTTKTEEKKKSSDATLNLLSVSPTGLKPSFSSSKTEYTLSVGSDVDSLVVSAIPTSDDAKVLVEGNTKLKEGKNTVTITVTAQDSTKKVYTITVTKNAEKKQLILSKLELAGITLSPEFSSDVYEYNAKIGLDVKSIDVTANSDREDAKIEVVGNKDLGEGENVITVLVRGDDDEVVTYQVNLTREAPVEKKDNKKLIYIIAGVAAVVVLITVIIIIVVIKKKKKKNGLSNNMNDYDEYENDEEYEVPNSLKKNNDAVNDEEQLKFDFLNDIRKENLESNQMKDKPVINIFDDEENDSKEDNKFKNDHKINLDALYDDDDDNDPRPRRGRHSK